MRKVKDLIEQLKKYDGEAMCYAYEGEVTGIVVKVGDDMFSDALIYCSPYTESEDIADQQAHDEDREKAVSPLKTFGEEDIVYVDIHSDKSEFID